MVTNAVAYMLGCGFFQEFASTLQPEETSHLGFGGVFGFKRTAKKSFSSACIAPNLVASHAGFPGLEEIS